MQPAISARTWADVKDHLAGQPRHTTLWVPRGSSLGHPRNWPGMRRSAGLPKGQLQDWRLRGSDGGCLHILAYQSGFCCHYDRVDPSVSLVRHIALDIMSGDCDACEGHMWS